MLHHLGHGVEVGSCVMRPRRIAGLDGIFIAEISTGPVHMLFLARGGVDLYACGDGAHGKLGCGDTKSHATPRRLDLFDQTLHKGDCVIQISAGECHSMAVSEQGWVYSWGSGVNGLHGHEEADNQWWPRPILQLETRVAYGASAGPSHSLVWTNIGELWAWGSGGSGQLGIGEVPRDFQRRQPMLIEPLDGIPIRLACAGDRYSIAITMSGDLYSFGLGIHGRLGHSTRSDCFTPIRVEALADEPALFACAGFDHTVVLTDRGHVFTFGRDAHGKLGRGGRVKHMLPKDMDNVLEASCVAAGALHHVADAKSDVLSLYAFGRNASTVFGHKQDVAVGHAADTTLLGPTRVEALVEGDMAVKEVTEVAVGRNHTVVRIKTVKGARVEFRAFGSNERGQLGLSSLLEAHLEKSVPTRVAEPEEG